MHAAAVVIADLDADGTQDLAFLSSSQGDFQLDQVAVRRGTGGGAFGPVAIVTNGDLDDPFQVADVDADGILDLLVLSESGDSQRVLLGLGDGSFADPIDSPTHDIYNPRHALGDLTGDGLADIAIAGPQVVFVQPGCGDGSFGPSEAFVASAGGGGLGLADFDHDGQLDLAVSFNASKNVWLYLNQHPD